MTVDYIYGEKRIEFKALEEKCKQQAERIAELEKEVERLCCRNYDTN